MMKRITSIKTLAARAAVTLLLALLTTATAWADNVNVSTATDFGTYSAGADAGTSGYYTLTNDNTYTLSGNVNIDGYLYVPEGVTATIDLAGHTIDRGLTSAYKNGSVIIVKGTLTITDSSTGGKVQGGYEAGDDYNYYTSCVKVLEGSTFNLQGGTLIGRDQGFDYTVSVVENSNFTMTGGKITEGWTGVLAFGNVTLTGGEISGNSYSGVRVSGNFSISGNPVITGNTEMNVDLRSSGGERKINITGALTDGANIGISAPAPTDDAPVTVTSGYGTYNSKPISTYFSLDNNGQIQTSPTELTVVMGWNEDGTEIAVGTALRTVTFDLQGHGSAIDAVSLLSGYKITAPTEPTAEGWSFGGWFTNTDFAEANAWNFDNGVTSDMTLYALWAQGQMYRVTLPENMIIVSADNEAVGGKYPTGTNIRFKVKSADYVVDGDVKNGEDVLTADGDGIYTVTVADADITITATIKKAAEPNKTLSGSENYTASNGNVLTGSTSGTVTIPDGASITLSDVTITGGIVCNGTATITLFGDNNVSGATNKAGIQVGGSGTTLTIRGNGSLTANGDVQSAGIGLSRAWDVDATGGDIVIEGGNITATGGSMGAGIGLGVAYDNSPRTITLGNITIKGGSVTATGGNQGKGIGTGYVYGLQNASNVGVGTITITTGIDRVEASSISGTVVYKHEDNDVTANASDYFTIAEDGSKRTITLREYTITYDLAGGTVATANPTTYTAASDAITLNNPTKDGYTFAGWTGTGLDAATTTVTIAKGSTGNREYTATWKKLLTNTDIKVSAIANQTYTGSALTPAVTVKDGTTDITSQCDIAYSNNTNVGTATVTITAKATSAAYSGETTTTFGINAADGSLTVPTAKTGLVYSGSKQDLITAGSSTTGTIQYSLDGTNYGTTVPQGQDAKEYTVYYKVVAKDGYKDVEPASLKVTIAPKTVSSPTITLNATEYEYDGTAKEPSVTSVKDGDTVIPASEYTVSYENNKEAGTATVQIVDKEGGNYAVSGSTTFTIKAKADPDTDPSYEVDANGVATTTTIEDLAELALDDTMQDYVEDSKLKMTVTPKNKYWTLACGVDLLLPEGVKVYKARMNSAGTKVELTEIDAATLGGVLKANNGVLIASTPGQTYDLVVSPNNSVTTLSNADAKSYGTDNELEPVLEDTHFTTEDYFILMENKFIMVDISKDTKVPAGKAVLKVAAGSAKTRTLDVIDGETTGISSAVNSADDEVWYNLQGQRISKPTRKGVYILNGKKVRR